MTTSALRGDAAGPMVRATTATATKHAGRQIGKRRPRRRGRGVTAATPCSERPTTRRTTSPPRRSVKRSAKEEAPSGFELLSGASALSARDLSEALAVLH